MTINTNKIKSSIKINFPQLRELKLASESLRKSLLQSETFLENISTITKKVSTALKEYENRTPDDLKLLADYGWFIDMETDIYWPNKLGELIRNGAIEEMNNYLLTYYENNLENIFNELKLRHIHRSEILQEIQSSYNEQKYYVSIPAILGQIDGICNDKTQNKFFLKDKNYLPKFIKDLNIMKGGITEIFLSPLTKEIPIYAYEKSEEIYPCKLNRHLIMHGVDYRYGTKENYLKSISLLKYLSDVLN